MEDQRNRDGASAGKGKKGEKKGGVLKPPAGKTEAALSLEKKKGLDTAAKRTRKKKRKEILVSFQKLATYLGGGKVESWEEEGGGGRTLFKEK